MLVFFVAVNLSQVQISEREKENIAQWYRGQLDGLNEKKQSLREEQYRRKKAQLRVEYWCKMDKVNNNATPTVING